MRNRGLAEHYIRLGMSNEMRANVEEWRINNRDPETGKMVSFSEAVRLLVERGLESKNRSNNTDGD